MKIRKT